MYMYKYISRTSAEVKDSSSLISILQYFVYNYTYIVGDSFTKVGISDWKEFLKLS